MPKPNKYANTKKDKNKSGQKGQQTINSRNLKDSQEIVDFSPLTQKNSNTTSEEFKKETEFAAKQNSENPQSMMDT